MRSEAWVLAAALLVAGCALNGPSAEYRTVTFEQTLDECPGEEVPCARVSLSYPEITGGPDAAVRAAVNRAILRPLLESIDIEGPRETPAALAEELFFYYGRTTEEFPDYAVQWYIERKAEIALDTLGILSVRHTDGVYTGGAHPLHQEFYRMFDLRTGAPLTADSIVAEGQRAELVALAEREFRRVREIPERTIVNRAGFWFPSGRFALNDNIGLTPGGLVVVFNPYEIAPYAMGPTRLELPYDSLRSVLALRR